MELIQDPVRWRAVLFAELNVKLSIQNGKRTKMDDTAWNNLA
jgi:hypothetical protein